jgi:lipoteichoic acid synthase
MISNLSFTKKTRSNVMYLSEYSLYSLFGISILLKCLLFQLDSQVNNILGVLLITLSSMGILLITFGILFLLIPKFRLPIVFIIYVCLSILLLSDIVYFRYYANVITVSLLKLSKFAEDVKGSVFDLFELRDILYVIDIPFFMVLMILSCIKRDISNFKFLKRLKFSLLIILVGIISFAIPRACIYPSLYKYDEGRAIKEMGVLYYHIFDTRKFIADGFFKSSKITSDELKEISNYYKNKAAENKNITNKRYTGIAKGKNLIVIQVEALQQFAINRVYNGQEVTPNLNKLIKNNIYFKNFYYQARSGNTADAEFLTNTSLYSLQHMGGIPYVNYANNKYPSLAKTLKNQGYSTYAFHGYKGSFWNRATVYKSLGFDKFTNSKDFSKNKNFGLGINDIDFFKESLSKLEKMSKNNKPFFSFFVTLSSHYPFDNFNKNYPFNIKGLEGTSVGKFFMAANYEDKAIGNFINALKKNGMYDNSLIVIYGDHNAIKCTADNEIAKLIHKKHLTALEWVEYQKVPCIIAGGSIKKGEVINTTGGEIDTLPTIANLMGLKYPYAMGKDLLNTKYGDGYAYSVARHDSFVTDNYFYINNLEKAYDLKTGKEINKNLYKKELKKSQDITYMSDTIISKNAFKTIKIK